MHRESLSASRPKEAKSRVSNGKTLFLGKVDGRRPEARRYRDLLESIIGELGGPDKVSETQVQLARRAATMCVHGERIEAAFVQGEKIDTAEYCSFVNSMARIFVRLGLLPKTEDNSDGRPTLREYLRHGDSRDDEGDEETCKR